MGRSAVTSVRSGVRRLRPGRDEGGTSAGLENRKRSPRHVPADGFEHRIAIAYRLGEVGCVVVDHLVGADVAQVGEIGGAAGGDDAGAEMLGKLDRKARDAARAALDQDRLAGFQFQRILDRAQRRQPRERESRGVNMRHRGRLLRDDGSIGSRSFRRKPLPGQVPEHRTLHRRRADRSLLRRPR